MYVVALLIVHEPSTIIDEFPAPAAPVTKLRTPLVSITAVRVVPSPDDARIPRLVLSATRVPRSTRVAVPDCAPVTEAVDET
ncbi:unannotated protein [freshwater metagenome]|uniref:Unannotated protein n=1 Tax=freshwater metagenome TaxID=449393 RepID=A0A6J7A6P3_9ZZZZ